MEKGTSQLVKIGGINKKKNPKIGSKQKLQ